MKYYSEELNKLFDTEDELLEAEYTAKRAKEEAEAAEKAKAAEKEKRYNEVKEAIEKASVARAEAEKLVKAYTREYGPISVRSSNINPFWFSL